ncbi:MAG: phage tail tip lysozyme [Enterococcus sp.]
MKNSTKIENREIYGMFTESQFATAQIVWKIFKDYEYSDASAAGIIGNLYAESSLDPNRNEVSGIGYGLGQWTPKSNLYLQAEICGISDSDANTTSGQAMIIAQGDRTGQWLNFGNTAYHSTVIQTLTLESFKILTNTTVATANFCAHWERPNVDFAHMDVRINASSAIYNLLKGTNGNEENNSNKKGKIEMKMLFEVDNKPGVVFYFDGEQIRKLNHIDEMKVLQDVYKSNNGINMPYKGFKLGEPYHARLLDVLRRTPLTAF